MGRMSLMGPMCFVLSLGKEAGERAACENAVTWSQGHLVTTFNHFSYFNPYQLAHSRIYALAHFFKPIKPIKPF